MTTRETHSPGDDCPGGHQDEAMTTDAEKRALEGDPEAGLKWAAELWEKLQERKGEAMTLEGEKLQMVADAHAELLKEQQMTCEHEYNIAPGWELACQKCGAPLPAKAGAIAAAAYVEDGGNRADSPLLGNAPPRRAGVAELALEIHKALFGSCGVTVGALNQRKRNLDTIITLLDDRLDALVPDSGALVEARTLLGRLTEEDLSSKEIGRITEDARRFLTQAQQPGPAVARGLDAQREADVRLARYLVADARVWEDAKDVANAIGDWRRAEVEA